MNRNNIPPVPNEKKIHVLEDKWSFNLKRLPDGIPLKYKALYCVHGDLQIAGFYYLGTYSPVVQWSTICLALTMIISNNWHTKQVDYTNSSSQEYLKEEFYIDPPRCFGGSDGISKVLRLITSLYGIRKAPRTFFDKLRDGLIGRLFVQ